MADYPRKFTVGRQSEQLYNEELHKIYESVKHLLDVPASNRLTPEAVLHGSLWLNLNANELKYYQTQPKALSFNYGDEGGFVAILSYYIN